MISLQQQILQFLTYLPQGKVTTYKALADCFHTHPRAVAVFMKTNRNPDYYPCYKVIAHNGHLSGYALGIDEKIRRLTHDGVQIIDDRIAEESIIRDLRPYIQQE